MSTIMAFADPNDTIVVQKDTTIVISKVYPNINIFGQITRWGKNESAPIGGKSPEIYNQISEDFSSWLQYDDSIGLKISVKYSELKEKQKALFVFTEAKYAHKWERGEKEYHLYILASNTLGLEQELEKLATADPSVDTATVNNQKPANSVDGDVKQKTGFRSFVDNNIIEAILSIFILIIMLLTIIVIIYVRINKISKKVDNLKIYKLPASLKSEDINIDKMRQIVISSIQSKDLIQRISDNDIYGIINKPDIQSYIQDVIRREVEVYLRDQENMPIPLNIGVSVQSDQTVQSELRTTKVEYRANDNCFIISENSQNKIFELYSTNGEYYYTIVNDSAIRKEMLGFITSLAGCVEIVRQDSPMPSTVEVFRDGRLIKNGDVYIVDANCKLQVLLR